MHQICLTTLSMCAYSQYNAKIGPHKVVLKSMTPSKNQWRNHKIAVKNKLRDFFGLLLYINAG